jgi:hypothetical protein
MNRKSHSDVILVEHKDHSTTLNPVWDETEIGKIFHNDADN